VEKLSIEKRLEAGLAHPNKRRRSYSLAERT
jgi:hypothetical protein